MTIMIVSSQYGMFTGTPLETVRRGDTEMNYCYGEEIERNSHYAGYVRGENRY